MRPRHSPVAVLLILPAGVLAGHALGYAGAGHAHGAAAVAAGHPHGYLSVAMAAAAPLAALALLAGMVERSPASVSFGQMLALQWGALVVQETVEHVIAGQPAATLVLARPLWLGLLAQLAVATGASLLLRSAWVVGSRLSSLPGRLQLAVLPAGEPATLAVVAGPRSRPRLTLAPRAPPALLG